MDLNDNKKLDLEIDKFMQETHYFEVRKANSNVQTLKQANEGLLKQEQSELTFE